jgi:hypothetical protein
MRKPRSTKAFYAKGGNMVNVIFLVSIVVHFAILRVAYIFRKWSQLYDTPKFNNLPGCGPSELFICSFMLLQEIQLSPLAQ